MAWSMATVRTQLQTAITSGTSIKQVYATVPTMAIVPCAIVSQAPGQFVDQTVMDDDTADLQFLITVLVSAVTDENSQNTLDGFVSADSIRDAIDSGKVTNVWSYAITSGAQGYGQYTFGDGQTGVSYLGFQIPVTVAVP